MTLDDAAFDYAEEWPDDTPLAVFRLHPKYRRIMAGLARSFADAYWFNGTDEQKTEMVEKMLVCAQQIELDYECPGGEDSMNNVVQVACIIPANEAPTVWTATWNQEPFNTLVGDTTGLASLDENGGIVLPAGNWLCFFEHRTFVNATNQTAHARVTDSEGTRYGAGTRCANIMTAHVVMNTSVLSDGENPIVIELNATAYATTYWSTGTFSEDRQWGSATFIELPS